MDASPGALAGISQWPVARPINLTRLMDMHARGEKIAAVSAYDATFAVTACRAGVECILVADDLAACYQGHAGPEDITLDALVYHVGNVARGLRSAQASAWLISDLPASSSSASPGVAMRHASRLVLAGAQMLRIRVDDNFAATAGFLSARGLPVCGHWAGQETPLGAGLVASLGDSGARFLVLEGMESASVQQLQSAQPQLLTLGLQAGLQTAGQLVSVHTLLGVHGWRDTAAGKSYLSRHGSIQLAMAAYVADVKANRFAQDAVCHG